MMTEQELRDLPIGSDVWYTIVKLFNAPSVRIRYNKKPIHFRKVKEEIMPMTNISVGCYLEDDSGIRYYRGYYEEHKCLFTEENPAWEYYDKRLADAMNEVNRRKTAYYNIAQESLGRLSDSRILAFDERLNRGGNNAV